MTKKSPKCVNTKMIKYTRKTIIGATYVDYITTKSTLKNSNVVSEAK